MRVRDNHIVPRDTDSASQTGNMDSIFKMRNSSMTTPEREKTTDSKHPTVTAIDEIPFTTECPVRNVTTGNAHVGSEDVTKGFRVTYAVRPGSVRKSWKSYKNVKYRGVVLSPGAIVYVNKNDPPRTRPPENASDDDLLKCDKKNFWVARIAEARAKTGQQVLLRVFWLYWPEELPLGRHAYHAKNELVLSNAMDIVDANTISSVAEVQHWDDASGVMPTSDLFWRQTFDMGQMGEDRKGGLSTLKKHCVCEGPVNPTMLHCTQCSIWNHKRCLRDAIARMPWQYFQQHTNPGSSPAPLGLQVGPPSFGELISKPMRSTKAVQLVEGEPNIDGYPTDRAGISNNTRKSHRSKGIAGSGFTATSWKGKLTVSISSGKDPENQQTSVTAKVCPKRNAHAGWTVPVMCLACNKPLSS